jgi:L-fuconolactonase
LRIDSHHSFSERYTLEYLDSILKRNRFDGSVLVAPPFAIGLGLPEIVRGIVVVLDLRDPQLPYILDEYQRHPRFKGVCHHFTGDIPDGLGELERRGIPLDAIAALGLIPRIVDRFPSLRIVIDHVGQAEAGTANGVHPASGADPLARAGPPGPAPAGQGAHGVEEAGHSVGSGPGGPPRTWARELEQAAQFPQVFCKLSSIGRLTPSARPYVQHALAIFGARRLMFGSDWPAGLPDTAWKASLAAFTQAIGAQTIDVREELLGGTAERFYGL